MIFIYIFTFLIFLGLNLKGKKEFLTYGLFHLKGYQGIKNVISSYGYQYHLRTHLFAIAVILSIIAFACYQFEVCWSSCIYLILVASYLFPNVMIWMLYHSYEEKQFSEFSVFLQTFIAIFKLHPKTLSALEECEKVCEGEILLLVQSMKQRLLDSGSIEESFKPLINYQPHFIVHNLMSMIITIETHGSKDYLDGLDLIQDDIDDWIEDTYAYKNNQLMAKNRMLMLCGLSSIIAIFAKNMLSEISFDTQSSLYQGAIVLFFLSLLMTLFFAHQMLSHCWFEKEEMIWKDSSQQQL